MADRVCRDQDLGPFVDGRDEFLNLAEGILRNQAEAEDVVQDSWLRWQNRSAGCVSARAFLRAIVRNLTLDRIRRRRSERLRLCTPQLQPPIALDAEETTIHRERLAVAEKVLAELP
ncbi:MAG: sigma factor, partial [Pseudomonadota bacterium]